tara:strand:+ start:27288 stop:27908 length:621 start_codon:yes stop_codon:yes gene_type:complete
MLRKSHIDAQNTEQPRQDADTSVNDSDEPGIRLKALRLQYGFSQRDLAKRAGVTNGTISMIEQGQVSPSVASLKKLAEAMSLTVAEFFTIDVQSVAQPFYRAADLVEIGGGGVSLRMVPAGVADAKLQVLREIYPPGADTGSELLSHVGEEAGVVVRGQITITVGRETSNLGPGDAFYFDSRIPHRFQNDGDEECEIVSTSTPRTF